VKVPVRLRTLVDLFSRRFFENDLLAPDIDLRPAAVWIVAALLAPSLLWTAKRVVPYGLMSVLGPDIMEMASWFDKSLLITLAMVNAGVVTLLTWEALLVDRRDAHVLGSLPVNPSLVVAAKGLALLRLLGFVALLNVPAAFVLAFEVYSHHAVSLVPRVFAVHAIVAMVASLSTAALLTAVLVVVTTLARGAVLRVVTVVVQALVLGILTGLLVGLQWTTGWLRAAFTGGSPEAVGWIVAWPPLWFVSLYQAMLPVELGRAMFWAHGSKALITAACALAAFPITLALWRWSLRNLVSASTEEGGRRRRASGARLAALLTPRPVERALVQFYIATLARSPRHRLAVVSALGLALALGFETVLLLSGRVGPTRWVTEFAVPLLVALMMSSTSLWLLALPAELPASWILGISAPFTSTLVRRALHRVLVLLIVVPSATLAGLLSAWQGGARSAAAHVGLLVLIALALVERNLAKVTYLPFATEYVPGRANLSARWPVYAATLIFVVPFVAEVERWLVTGAWSRWLTAIALGGVWLATLVIRRHRRVAQLTMEPDTGVAWTPVTLDIGQALHAAPRALQ
jgi:hypothetical protein